jgi:hypothetical protein
MIIRIQKDKNNPYVIINKKFLNDRNLSWQAKGLLTYLFSLPDDWEIKVEDLKNRSKNGRDSTNTIIKELIHHNYIKREKKEKEKGMFRGYNYVVSEEPFRETRDGISVTDNPELLYNKELCNKEQRSDSEESPKIFKIHKLTKFWNEMSNTRKHKETSKIHIRINQLIKDLKNGKFYEYYWNDNFLKQNKIDSNLLKKEWSNKEIKEILLQLNNLYEDRYWPYDKSKLPRDFETMLYNKRTGKSFFLMCVNNPPQLLKKEKKSNPKNIEWYNKYKELFGVETNQKFITMFNEFYTRAKNILENVEPLYRHTSFSRYVGSVRRPHIFFELHMQWLKKQTKLFPGLLKGIPWDNFCSYVLKEYNFCLVPDHKQVRKLKREYKKACQRIQEKKERRI